MKAFGYTRVSSRGQVDGHGPERQKTDIAAFASRRRIEITGWYSDAHTGTESDRPEFAAMLEALLSNGVRTVIVESLDRLARDLLVQSTLLAKLAAEGITLLAANTGEDVTAAMQDDPMRKALIQIQGIFAELDKNLVIRKLRKAREAKRDASGRCEGRKPYGYHEAEKIVLARIHRLRRKPRGGERIPISQVVVKLNEEGLRNRSGGLWTIPHIRKILKSAK